MRALPSAPAAVIFDLDGTLVDTIDLIVATFQQVHRDQLGLEISREDVLPWIGRTLPDIYGQVAAERSQELTDAYLDWNLAHLAELQKSYDGTRQLLMDLRADGRKVAIATSKRHRSASASLEAARMTGLVDVVVGMDDTREHKPHPAPILLALEKLGARAEESVYVGDAVPDVLAARAAGVASIAVTWGAGHVDALRAAEPTMMCDTVTDLRAALHLRAAEQHRID